jgi:tetratricopeptide (TPR) repeat protein
MEENAADLCKSYLDKSLDYDSSNPETLQLLASYWLSKDDLEQAKKCILQSIENWLPKYVEASEQDLLIDPTEVVPLTYDSRINTSRILTEVQEFDTALTVLEQLVEEDDEVVVVWYMLGWVNYCKGEEYFSNAKYYLKRASEMAAKIKYEQKYLDEQLREHVAELLAKLVEVASEEEDEEREEEIVEGVDYETGDEDEEVDENNNLKGDEECMET